MRFRLLSWSRLKADFDWTDWAWCIAGAILLSFFVGSAVSEIYPGHFRTWYANPNIDPDTDWALFWKGSRFWVSRSAYVLSGISGFIGVTRALQGAWHTTVWRFVAAFAFGIGHELVRVGVQDGSVADKDVVSSTSLVLIGLGLALPVVFALYDVAKMADSGAEPQLA